MEVLCVVSVSRSRQGADRYTLHRMRSQEELRQELLSFENKVLHALVRDEDANQLAQLRTAANHVQRLVAQGEALGTLAPATRHLGARIGQRLERLTDVLRAQERETMLMRVTTRNELRILLQASLAPPEGQREPPVEKMDMSLNSTYMRAWFLENLGHPFPSREDKNRILKKTNASARTNTEHLAYNQAVLWFINTRRRSGWTTFLRSYAAKDKAMLLEIAWAIQSEQGGSHASRGWSAGPRSIDGITRPLLCNAEEETPTYALRQLYPEASEEYLAELRKSWNEVIERIKVGAKDRIGDWVDEVIRLSDALQCKQDTTMTSDPDESSESEQM